MASATLDSDATGSIMHVTTVICNTPDVGVLLLSSLQFNGGRGNRYVTETQTATPWLLLIYTVPRTPSRKRAYVWRELKKVGAVYLRDGVGAVPNYGDTASALEQIAAKVREYEGQATIVEAASLDSETTTFLIAEATAARASEYEELVREADAFLAHVDREREHRELTYAELEELEADLEKIRRWFAQVRARDYFPVNDAREQVETLIGRCAEALDGFLDDVFQEVEERPA